MLVFAKGSGKKSYEVVNDDDTMYTPGVDRVAKLDARFLLLSDVWRSECLARDRSRGYQKS